MAANDDNDTELVPGSDEAAVKPGTQFWNVIGADGIPRGAVVTYEDPADSLEGHKRIQEKVDLAIRKLNGDTRLRVLFKEMSPTDNQWIRFEYKSYINGPVSSVSEIGKYRLKAEKVETDFVQNVYISDKAEVGNVMHELMHVLGFMHEQQRDDRDTYVAIDVEFKKNVNYKKEAISVPPEAPYDIYSIMHYSLCDKVITFRHAYIEWLKSTVFPGKTEEEINGLVGQRKKLSDGDAKGVGWVYGNYGCTYAAFLDNPCKHMHYLCEDCDKRICLYCQETCSKHKDHKVKLVEDHTDGFVCGCAERDEHATHYETHAHEYEAAAN